MYDILDRSRRYLIIGSFSAIVLIGTIEIFLRYTPGLHSFSWADEIMRYLNIWLIFLGAGLATKTNGHMSMDFFVKKIFPETLHPLIAKITIAVTFSAIFALGIICTQKTLNSFQVMIQAFEIPIAIFYAALPIGCFLMCIEYALIFVYGANPFAALKEEAR